MPKLEFRFDIAAILLASVLTVLGISAAEAGDEGGDVHSRSGLTAASAQHERPARPGGFHTSGGAAGGIVGSGSDPLLCPGPRSGRAASPNPLR